jgi:hypothetical protein
MRWVMKGNQTFNAKSAIKVQNSTVPDCPEEVVLQLGHVSGLWAERAIEPFRCTVMETSKFLFWSHGQTLRPVTGADLPLEVCTARPEEHLA